MKIFGEFLFHDKDEWNPLIINGRNWTNFATFLTALFMLVCLSCIGFIFAILDYFYDNHFATFMAVIKIVVGIAIITILTIGGYFFIKWVYPRKVK